MNNLFSIFEPSAISGIPLNWLSSLSFLCVVPLSIWISKPKSSFSLKHLTSIIYEEFRAVMPSSPVGSLVIPFSLFLTIALNNFLGLFPFIFTSSSHPVFTVSLALPLWLGHMLTAWSKTSSHMFAHLVPLGTPFALMPLMVLIELVSSLIRPLTLSIRLAANMVAGHLLLTLLGSQIPGSTSLFFMIILSCAILLSVLEMAVSLIQAYVFSILSTLYLSEVPSTKF